MSYIIGIDEVGRGPVAGPVTVCVCAIKEGVDIISFFPKNKLRDSKKLSEKQRQEIIKNIQPFVKDKSIIFSLGERSANEIDELGISLSIKEAIKDAMCFLHKEGIKKDAKIFLDGSLCLDSEYINQETVIKGDERIGEISLASIIAKEYRDSFMKNISSVYSNYDFENNVGYGTKFHYEAIKKYGLTDIHRKSFLKNFS